MTQRISTPQGLMRVIDRRNGSLVGLEDDGRSSERRYWTATERDGQADLLAGPFTLSEMRYSLRRRGSMVD